MPKISIPQKNLVLNVDHGKNLMDALIEASLPVASSCLGEGICSKCAVISNPIGLHSDLEKRTLEKNKLDLSYRLCCQLAVHYDLEIKTSYW